MDNSPEKLLKKAKLKCTPVRLSILELFLGEGKPLSQSQIAEKLNNKDINKTTIYRNLQLFLDSGLINKAFLDQRTDAYEINNTFSKSHTHTHPHFTCLKCKKTSCLPESSLIMPEKPAGYVIKRQKILLEGFCPNCK